MDSYITVQLQSSQYCMDGPHAGQIRIYISGPVYMTLEEYKEFLAKGRKAKITISKAE
jgi:hypothetical protein